MLRHLISTTTLMSILCTCLPKVLQRAVEIGLEPLHYNHKTRGKWDSLRSNSLGRDTKDGIHIVVTHVRTRRSLVLRRHGMRELLVHWEENEEKTMRNYWKRSAIRMEFGILLSGIAESVITMATEPTMTCHCGTRANFCNHLGPVSAVP